MSLVSEVNNTDLSSQSGISVKNDIATIFFSRIVDSYLYYHASQLLIILVLSCFDIHLCILAFALTDLRCNTF